MQGIGITIFTRDESSPAQWNTSVRGMLFNRRVRRSRPWCSTTTLQQTFRSSKTRCQLWFVAAICPAPSLTPSSGGVGTAGPRPAVDARTAPFPYGLRLTTGRNPHRKCCNVYRGVPLLTHACQVVLISFLVSGTINVGYLPMTPKLYFKAQQVSNESREGETAMHLLAIKARRTYWFTSSRLLQLWNICRLAM